MANIIAGTQGVQQPSQVQQTQSTSKTTKASNTGNSAPQDSVTISSEGRAAQLVAQTNSGGGKK